MFRGVALGVSSRTELRNGREWSMAYMDPRPSACPPSDLRATRGAETNNWSSVFRPIPISPNRPNDNSKRGIV